MWIKIAQFIWNHFWKMLCGASWLFILWFADSVQQPEKVRATIETHSKDIARLDLENINIKIALGVNKVLYKNIDRKLDTKMDKMTESINGLSYEIKQLRKER